MSQIQQVKDANNIVEIISERIKLDQSGTNYRACCPFHNEKTPSFFVNEQMQRYRCFGCGASGDVLDFVQNFEGISFYEALKTLADRVGIQLKEYQRTSEDEEREQLLEILDLTKEYYHFLLTQHEIGQGARDYLAKRGTTAESIKVFQLGYSLDSWDGLIRYLHDKKKFSLAVIEKTGLLVRGKTGRFYDRFRGRLMFPLKDHRGQVVGFSGRILSADAKEAKYINSPETLLYHKSKLLFGYSELIREIKKKEAVIVVEGEFDMISSTQAHVNNVVAIKGSALTHEQVHLLARVAKTIILSLDADEAGVKATKRAIEIVKGQDIDLRVIDLKHLDFLSEQDKVKDPDELARSNPKLWRQATDTTISAYQFLLNRSLDVHDPQTPEGKREIINELAPVLQQISHAVEKEYYLQQLAKILNVKSSLLEQDIAKFGKKATETVTEVEQKDVKKDSKTFQEKNEEYLLFLLFRHPVSDWQNKARQLSELTWSAAGLTTLLQQLLRLPKVTSLQQLAQSLAEDLKARLMEIVLQPEYEQMMQQVDLASEWQKMTKVVAKDSLRAEIQTLNQEIKNLDALNQRDGEQEKRLDELLALIVSKQQAIQKLR